MMNSEPVHAARVLYGYDRADGAPAVVETPKETQAALETLLVRKRFAMIQPSGIERYLNSL